VIGERIRDKVAASKARGMWMGGKVPLGYDVRDRKLVVNEAEAARVRRVFELFAETGSGVETARRLGTRASPQERAAADKGDVYKLLHNRTYAGEVAHKGRSTRASTRPSCRGALGPRARRPAEARGPAPTEPEPDAGAAEGLIFGADGRALSPTHCRKSGRLYRYYVAQRVLKGDAAADDGIVRRVSAAEIEAAVVARSGAAAPARGRGRHLAGGAGRGAGPDRGRVRKRWSGWTAVGGAVPGGAGAHRAAAGGAGEVGPAGADIRLRVAGWRASSVTWARCAPTRREGGGMSEAASIVVRVPLHVRRRPGRKTVVTPVQGQGEAAMPTRADPALVKALARAFRYQRLLTRAYASISEMARPSGSTALSWAWVCSSRCIAHGHLEAIMDGRQPAELALPELLERSSGMDSASA
jgi:hypothetical protein